LWAAAASTRAPAATASSGAARARAMDSVSRTSEASGLVFKLSPTTTASARRCSRMVRSSHPRCRPIEPPGLQEEHAGIAPACTQQLVMGSLLYDTASVEHYDAVGAAHRGEPMRDEDGSEAVGD